MTNASNNFKWGFTPDSNPKRDNTKMGNKIDINLCESAKAKQNSVVAYLIVFSEYGMTNASSFGNWFFISPVYFTFHQLCLSQIWSVTLDEGLLEISFILYSASRATLTDAVNELCMMCMCGKEHISKMTSSDSKVYI